MYIEMTGNAAIKQVVEAGLGPGIVSVHTIELELETGRLTILALEGLPIELDWYVLRRKGKRLSPAAVAFKEFMLNEAARFIRLPDERL